MNAEQTRQVADPAPTPGQLLRAARLACHLSERDAEDQLNLMPGYVALLESDNYQALRSPAFARGYVKAFGKLVDLDEGQLLAAFDQLRASRLETETPPRQPRRPLQLQHTGVGVLISLAVVVLMIFVLWWRAGTADPAPIEEEAEGQAVPSTAAQTQAPEIASGT